ncbi:MAG: ABC transporter permease [gamma proteobacterium symbiont of Ctena orbiculata]|nr:ABC transporter permease [Candidatus Thiodiazotropha taylori]PVV06500.1 MAG: ABC transporter permease [gamma proteobacterium symbiont of Ctena orbiculata]MBT2995958.1 ABC transporter permease [Candidatus Thiodiazotropha taylori]MBT2999274.1 ABC transporter permease [Candidatus Thiodiazotropha taylori]MBT3025957.1 ABC transporter permease [Candidatus Thiodiazotropha taylori]
MLTYLLRRLLLMLPTLLGITLVVFVVMAASPGGISAQSLVEGQNLDPEAKKEIEAYYNRLYGLDDPPYLQYLRWLNNVSPIGFTFDEDNRLSGFSFSKGSDLGRSFRYGRPVTELLAERVPITILLNVLSIPIVYLLALLVGVRAATERGRSFDVSSGMVMLALWSVPTMLAGVLMIGFFANEQYWRWFPTAGLSDRQVLDQVFMPHWSSLWDIALLFLVVTLAISLFMAMGRIAKRPVREILFGLVWGLLGAAMVSQLPELQRSPTLWVVAPAVFALLAAWLASSDYRLLRQLGFLTTGLLVGLLIAVYLMQGSWVRGFLLDRLWHLALPVICLSYGGFAGLAKLTRTAVLENLLSDYARTARAKGLAEAAVLWRHVFRNSLLPLITVAASLLPSLLAGSVIVESIFSIEGMGKLAVEAVQTRDRELVLSITLIGGCLTLLGYLLADILYALADPRVSYE